MPPLYIEGARTTSASKQWHTRRVDGFRDQSEHILPVGTIEGYPQEKNR